MIWVIEAQERTNTVLLEQLKEAKMQAESLASQLKDSEIDVDELTESLRIARLPWWQRRKATRAMQREGSQREGTP